MVADIADASRGLPRCRRLRNFVPLTRLHRSNIPTRDPTLSFDRWPHNNPMFNGLHTMSPTDAQLATDALNEEGNYRFPSFSSSDAVTLGLSLRKRFRGTSRHTRGKGLVISIQTIAGHTLFACTVGDLSHVSGISDVSLDSWACIDGMINVVRRTGHSSFYVEKGMGAMGKTPKQMGIQGDFRINGGAFPIWLENGYCCPIAVVACYSGSSQDDHHLVVTTVRDYLNKLTRESEANPIPEGTVPVLPPRDSTVPSEWLADQQTYAYRSEPMDDHRDDH